MNTNEREIVSMTRDAWSDHMEYVHLLEKDQELLECLHAAGVENWEGYSDAIDMLCGGEGADEE